MDHAAEDRHTAAATGSPSSSRRLLVGIAAATCLVGGAAAEAAPSSAASSSICSRVSAASVSAIVGYTVPAGTFSTLDLKPTKQNGEIGSDNSICTYGVDKTLADVEKAVILNIAVTTKPVTQAEIEASVTKTEQAAKVKFTISSYSGLNVPGYYLTENISGIRAQVIAGVSGTHNFVASVDSSKVSESELGKLAALAEKL
jgi:hypothetical protein